MVSTRTQERSAVSQIQAQFQLAWPGFQLDVDLTLPGAGITVLFGASGSGKTTVLRCMAGLSRSPVGRCVVGGVTWQDHRQWVPTHARDLGYVFQEPSLLPHLDVMGNLRYGMKRSQRGSSALLDQAIDLLGIESLLHRSPLHLSGGEQQRVGIARALALGPRLLLMDEPLSALDIQRKQEVMPYLERLHQSLSVPIVYVTHALDEVAALADHVVVLDQGRVVASDDAATFLTRVDLPVRLGEEAGAIMEVTVGEVDEAWHLARLDFDGGSLWTQDTGRPPGTPARIRVLARDVSLAIERPSATSIQNLLQGQVLAVVDDGHPALSLVQIRVGAVVVLARLTKRAAAALNVTPGQSVWLQVKSVALLK